MWVLWTLIGLIICVAAFWWFFIRKAPVRGAHYEDWPQPEIDESQLEGDLRHAVTDINFGAGK